MSDWMGRMPQALRNMPLCTWTIPGSHDSGAFSFNLRMGYAHDQAFLKYVRPWTCRFVKKFVRNWGVTQKLTIEEQLIAGVRYLDLRFELALNPRLATTAQSSETDGKTSAGSLKSLFVVHGLYADDWLKICEQVVAFLANHEQEVIILNVSHVYCMTEFDFRRFFLQPLCRMIAQTKITLCLTYVDLRKVTFNELLALNFRLIVIGPFENEWDGCIFKSAAIQNKWPRKNNVPDLMTWIKSQLHGPQTAGIRVTQGVVTPELSDIIRNLRTSLKEKFSIPCRNALKDFIDDMDLEELTNLNVMICDQVDYDIIRRIYMLNVAHLPGYELDGFSSQGLSSISSESTPVTLQVAPTGPVYPTPPQSDKNHSEEKHQQDEEPEILIEEIFDDSPSIPPKKPKRTSVMIQQIEMVLIDDDSKESSSTSSETRETTGSPAPPPKPKRFSQRIPIIMEVEPIPDNAVSLSMLPARSTPLSRSSDTPVRIALPVTAEELRLAALGEYPTYGSARWQEEVEKRRDAERIKKKAEEEEKKKKKVDLSRMVESLVVHSTEEAMENLADHFKAHSETDKLID